ncbi:cytochrome P450 4C1 [Ptiloglossa arizonensis]|uniref:cytochrome P450 4C1 n=1 Tax=Ptiloglossa arizonensis TaxID=3350558 RepID=UPI003FA18177
MITGILFLIALGLLLHFFILHYGNLGRKINSIPGPQVMPLFGNLYQFPSSPAGIWNHVRELGSQYYPIYRVWTFLMPFVNIRHPDDIETILGNSKANRKSEVYDLLMPWFSTGLLTSSGRKWQVRRKILTPAFHFNVLQQFADVFIEESERLSTNLKKEGGPSIKDLMPFYSEHTLNIICETAMGTSLKDKGPFQQKYRKAVYDIGKLLIYRLVRPWFHSDFIFKFFPKGWYQAKVLKILHGFTTEVIEERKDYHKETNGRFLTGFTEDPNQTEGGSDVGVRKRRLAMLDLLIAAHNNNQIDDIGIREEVDTFMFRGHDTTAVSLCFTTMLLAENKEIQARARAEVKAVMEENNGKVTMSSLQNMQYLERCIKESLRLYPSVPFISRCPEMNMRLSNFNVPSQTTVHVHIIDVHRDPKYWPDPEVYNPDRFLPENIKGRHPYSYIPFSAGPRNCIGQRFAMMELKTTLAFLLNSFYFESVDRLKDLSIDADLVIRPTNSLRIKFTPIEAMC